ncbi:MAG: hypothetical protein WCC11_08725 [Gammaproteobacteria bacterium]
MNTESIRTSVFCGLLVLLAGCSSSTIVEQGQERQPVIDNWQNVYLYFSPPAHYEVIGMVTGKGRGLSDEGKMEHALEGMKEEALDAGATGVLLQSAGTVTSGSISTATWNSNDYGGSAFGASIPITRGSIMGLAIYVPQDVADFTRALQAHQTTYGNLSTQKDAMKAAVNNAKKIGTKTDIAAAEHNLQTVKDAEDAEFCGEDGWYADQMTAQQQLMDKMRAEEAASQNAAKKDENANHNDECLAAAKKNDLAIWRKLGCK